MGTSWKAKPLPIVFLSTLSVHSITSCKALSLCWISRNVLDITTLNKFLQLQFGPQEKWGDLRSAKEMMHFLFLLMIGLSAAFSVKIVAVAKVSKLPQIKVGCTHAKE